MTKIDIITGFLGSGKTTFILKLIEAFSKTDKKIVIIENEFGKIGIDGTLIKKSGIPVYEISNGCVCCTLKGDFQAALDNIVDTLQPDHIIIEPSGIFIIDDFNDIIKGCHNKYNVNSCVCIVDCLSFLKQKQRYTMFFQSQLKSATSIVLSKSQFVDDVSLIVSELNEINPNVSVTNKDWQEIDDATLILGGGMSVNCEVNSSFLEGHGFETFGMQVNNKVKIKALNKLLISVKNGLYGEIIRMKGIVKTEHAFVEFQYANGYYSIKESLNDTSTVVSAIGENILENKLLEFFTTGEII